MMSAEPVTYRVVVNDEGQYSICPVHLDDPLGLRVAGQIGPEEECLEYIGSVGIDMRPLSLRRAM
jgi:MbtH protein